MNQPFPPPLLPYQRVGQATGLLTKQGFSSTIFEEMSLLNNQHGAINLGQGFPDTDGPSELFDAAISAMRAGFNQYAPISGHPQLRAAIAEHQRRFYHQHVDSETQVLVTAGASEALSASIAALINPGDEVIIFEPYYDIYPAAVALAGGNVKTVPLQSPTFEPNVEQLEAAFSERTALVIVNDPHNPTGAVFSSEVKKRIVELACQFDAVMIQDAVYEHLVFEDSFEPLFALPGASERTLFVSAISKTHSLTGWRVGWVVGSADLIAPIKLVKGYYSHSAAAPLQVGAAAGLNLPGSFYASLVRQYAAQRDILLDGLQGVGLKLMQPAGTFFIAADAGELIADKGLQDAEELARILPEQAGVTIVPMSAFVTAEFAPHMQNWIRFAFCKKPEILQEAVERFQSWGLR
ncbi:aminotransferase [Mycobacteroides abscessus subsp. abscessus]|nr:aminotransferase [Mycobacteroides abscessus subsp. abscessus]